MIFDSAKNLDFYRGLGVDGRYEKAVDFLKNTDLVSLAPGKYEIDGKNVFANVTEYTTVPWEEAKYEAHHNYTDIQYVISGSETMTYARIDELNEKVPYNEEKDVVFYDNENPGLKVVVKAGEYMIFNPWDGHKPKAAAGEPALIKKVIVKIKEN
ncbi:YhcH/YjgK/YiaL family protein [Lacrimispora sphenoides]|uniref:YhcH/YjgK/YiaL family protein n=1 Tax=Lacrimispora sphenoides JCM 1415 TaxID=1297793 RepID=A0ABY1C7K9_9FIRM|nr:YhcH/YjgK/YiaL family protein [Lacrimispora sphenoides]SET76974.1 YhcH/YjgK/YiaL family protein [[Clostridium] sphenoides JCM 1415]SUY51127.1 beta-D-galactosidase [Lacrimispora sphenoides]